MQVVEVKFGQNDPVHQFDASNVSGLKKGDFVIVDFDSLIEFGEIVSKPKEKGENELFKVIRKATSKDIETKKEWAKKEKDAIPLIEKSVKKFNLDMKLVEVRYAFSGGKILVVYTASERVDFRELVRELASIFRTRVELRQIGLRDEAKRCGNCGPCGRELCCRKFLSDYSQVTIKMAKTQGIALNPNKINGVCGKLMCCLSFEYDTYKAVEDKMPEVGSFVKFKNGEGEVVFRDLLKEEVTLKIKKDDSFELKNFKLNELNFKK